MLKKKGRTTKVRQPSDKTLFDTNAVEAVATAANTKTRTTDTVPKTVLIVELVNTAETQYLNLQWIP